MRISQRQLNKKKVKKEKLRYSTRKLSTGLASCIIGFTFIFVAGKTMESTFSSSSYAADVDTSTLEVVPTEETPVHPTEGEESTVVEEPQEQSISGGETDDQVSPKEDKKTVPKSEVLELKGENFTNSAVVNSVDNGKESKIYEKYNVQIDNDEHNGIKNEKSTYSYAKPIVSNEFNKDDYSSYQKDAFNKISNNMIRIAKDNDDYKVSDKDKYTGYHMRYDLGRDAVSALNELSKATTKDSKNEATFYIGVPDVLSIVENSKKVELTNGRLENKDIVLNGDNAKSFVLPNYDNLRKNNKVEKPSNDLKEVAKEKINDVKTAILDALDKSGDKYKLSSDAVKSYFDNGKFKIYTLKYDLGFENKLSGAKNDPKLGIGVSFNADLKDYNVPMNTLFAVVDSNNNIYSYVYQEKLREPANNKELKEYASNRIAELEAKMDSLKGKDDADSKSELEKLENIKANYEDLAKSDADNIEDVKKVIEKINNKNVVDEEKENLKKEVLEKLSKAGISEEKKADFKQFISEGIEYSNDLDSLKNLSSQLDRLVEDEIIKEENERKSIDAAAELADEAIKDKESPVDPLSDLKKEREKEDKAVLETEKKIEEALEAEANKASDFTKAKEVLNEKINKSNLGYEDKIDLLYGVITAKDSNELAKVKSQFDKLVLPESEAKKASEETIAAERKANDSYLDAAEKAYDAIINSKSEVKPEVKPEAKPVVNTSSNSSSASSVDRSSGMSKVYRNNSSSKATSSTEGQKPSENKFQSTESKPAIENKANKPEEKLVTNNNENKPASTVVSNKGKTGKLANYDYAYRVIEKKVSNVREDATSEVSSDFIDAYLKDFAELANLSGQEKIDKALELSKRYFQSSDKVLFVHVDSKLDMKVLAKIINEKRIPVVFFDGKNVDQNMNDELTRLGAKKVSVANLNNEVQFDSISGFNSKLEKKNLEVKDNDDLYRQSENI